MTTNSDIKEIEIACQEIANLLTMGSCQKYQVLTEVEIILEHLSHLKRLLDTKQ